METNSNVLPQGGPQALGALESTNSDVNDDEVTAFREHLYSILVYCTKFF